MEVFTIARSPKSFRLGKDDLEKFNSLHKYYKNKFEVSIMESNMYNLHRWSEAQTLAVLIREKFSELNDNDELEK